MKRIAAIILMPVFLLTLCGCWDMNEINTTVFVMGIGIDKGDTEGEYNFTFQLADTMGSQSDSGKSAFSFVNYTISSRSLTLALQQLILDTNSDANFEHLCALVIGSEIADEGAVDLIDHLFRLPSVRRKCVVATADAKASDLLRAKAGTGDTAMGINRLMSQYTSGGGSVMSQFSLHQLYTARTSGIDYYLLIVSAQPLENVGGNTKGAERTESVSGSDSSGGNPDKVLEVVGLCSFIDGVASMRLGVPELETARLVSQRQSSGIISCAYGGSAQDRLYFRVQESHCSQEVEIVNDTPSFHIELTLTCYLVDTGSSARVDIGDEEWIESAQEQIVQSLEEDLRALVTYSKEGCGAQLLELETTLRQKHYRWYEEHPDYFHDGYKDAQVSVNVNCTLQTIGFIA